MISHVLQKSVPADLVWHVFRKPIMVTNFWEITMGSGPNHNNDGMKHVHACTHKHIHTCTKPPHTHAGLPHTCTNTHMYTHSMSIHALFTHTCYIQRHTHHIHAYTNAAHTVRHTVIELCLSSDWHHQFWNLCRIDAWARGNSDHKESINTPLHGPHLSWKNSGGKN